MEDQARNKKRSIFKRWWFWVLIVLTILAIASLGGDEEDDINEPTPQEQVTVPEETDQDEREEDQVVEEEPEEEPTESEEEEDTTNEMEDVVFSNTLIQSDPSMTMVYGEVKNNDTKARSFTIKVTFYDNSQNIIGSASGAVNDLNGGESKIFSAIGTDDVSDATSHKVQVDTMVETKDNSPSVISFGEPFVRSEAGITMVDVETTNNNTIPHSFTVTIGFYDSNNQLIGVATGAMNDLGAGEKKTLSAMASGDYSGAASNKIFVDTMVE